MSQRLPRNSTILIDTNLAILLCVGLSGPSNIEKHKRLAAYDEQDFHLLTDLLGDDPSLVFSPYVLGETSNLVRQVANPLKRQLCTILRELILRADEVLAASSKIVDDIGYMDLGMTDAALLTVLDAHPKLALLTQDASLYLAASSRGFSAFNFSHVRDERKDFQ